jgi:hypothetical protein
MQILQNWPGKKELVIIAMLLVSTWAGCDTSQNQVCHPKTLSGMTFGQAFGNEAADGRVSYPASACCPILVRATSAA